MLDDFFVRALLAAAGVACVAAPVGCILLWRRMAYFGDTMAHSALLGVAIGSIVGIGLGTRGLPGGDERGTHPRRPGTHRESRNGCAPRGSLPLDARDGRGPCSRSRRKRLRAQTFSGTSSETVLAVTREDLVLIWGGGALCLGVLVRFWRGLVAASLHEDLARAEGVPVVRLQML